jgi:hypothetical protein
VTTTTRTTDYTTLTDTELDRRLTAAVNQLLPEIKEPEVIPDRLITFLRAQNIQAIDAPRPRRIPWGTIGSIALGLAGAATLGYLAYAATLLNWTVGH